MPNEVKASTIAAIVGSALVALSTSGAAAPQHQAEHELIKCGGINSCKGTSACSSAQNSCKGQNACKGKGWLGVKSEKECKDRGGKVLADKKEHEKKRS